MRTGIPCPELGACTMRTSRATAGSAPSATLLRDVPRQGTPARMKDFRSTVWKYWKEHGRHDLPWRLTHDPYRILVSEVMLQQTQVSRVEGKYREFLRRFPTVHVLAKAPLADVLRVWSGLGYNRRAKFLHNAAKEIVERYSGKVPREYASLQTLPGVGDYTAKAVRVFAWNEPEVLIETNIRTACIHHFYSNILQNIRISDKEIVPYMEQAAKGNPPDGGPREWNWALMDYGAHLKASGVRVNARSAHYTKQSKFEGSLRQVRGAILKALAHKTPMNDEQNRYPDWFNKALVSLARDGLIGNDEDRGGLNAAAFLVVEESQRFDLSRHSFFGGVGMDPVSVASAATTQTMKAVMTSQRLKCTGYLTRATLLSS